VGVILLIYSPISAPLTSGYESADPFPPVKHRLTNYTSAHAHMRVVYSPCKPLVRHPISTPHLPQATTEAARKVSCGIDRRCGGRLYFLTRLIGERKRIGSLMSAAFDVVYAVQLLLGDGAACGRMSRHTS
jgi:hypothetical protein